MIYIFRLLSNSPFHELKCVWCSSTDVVVAVANVVVVEAVNLKIEFTCKSLNLASPLNNHVAMLHNILLLLLLLLLLQVNHWTCQTRKTSFSKRK